MIPRRLLLPLFSLLIFSCAPPAFAQYADVGTNTAQVPQPGSDHHYIGLGTETVNPVDGSVSFHLPIALPQGRGLTMPFGIDYSYPYNMYVTDQNHNGIYWGPDQWNLTKNGWSLGEPYLTGMTAVAATAYVPTGPPPAPAYIYTCLGSGAYGFRGFDQTHRSFNVYNEYLDSISAGNPTLGGFCPQTAWSSDSRHGYLATTPTTSTLYVQPAVTITDPSGTAYVFPNGPTIDSLSGSPSNPTTQYWKLRPTSITDRDGNQMLSTTDGWTDTLGRSVVSWSSDQSTITVSGLSSNIVEKWSTLQITGIPLNGTGNKDGTGFAGCSSVAATAATVPILTEIDLPDSQKYQFQYDSVGGRITKIIFPGGGYVRYVWGTDAASAFTHQVYYQAINAGLVEEMCDFTYDKPAITDRYVSYDGTTEVLHQKFSYTPATNWNATQTQVWKTTTVTTTDSLTNLTTITVYKYGWTYSDQIFLGSGTGPGSYVPIEQSVVYENSSGTAMKTVYKNWLNIYAMIGEETVLNDGTTPKATTVLRCYDANEQIGDVYEYGFASEGSPTNPTCSSLPPGGTTLSYGLNTSVMGPIRRQTHTVNHNFPGASPSTHIVNRPDSITVQDGSGNTVKQTTSEYTSCPSPQSSGAIYLVTPATLRGDTCSTSRWANLPTSTWLKTSYAYYDTGQVYTSIDPCGNSTCSDMTGINHKTTYTYTDNFASGTGTAPGQTNAYLHKLTNPNSAVDTFSWGYNDGLVRSHTDQNSQVTNYIYNTPPSGCSFPDGLDRLSEIDSPDGGKTKYCYNDTPYNRTTPSPSVTTERLIQGSTYFTTLVAFDGLGHTVSVFVSDPDCSTGDRTDTVYDGLGQKYTVSNPYCTTSDPTYGLTTYVYDVIGRTTKMIPPDGTSSTDNVATVFAGNTTTVTDEAGIARESITDGLGHLTQVFENPAGLNYETDYTYDTLDNLLTVNQKGGSANSANWRTRTFNYDSLSRLICSSNPENSSVACPATPSASYTAGTTGYIYDANSNLASKTSPRPNQTGTNSVVASYTYDVLNRLSQKSFNDGSTPTVQYGYDAVALTGCATTPPALTDSYPIGRRTAMCDGAGAGSWSHDVMGRTLTVSRTTNTITLSTVYVYLPYVDGSVNTITYPSGRSFSYVTGTAERPLSVEDNSTSVFYANAAHYVPPGGLLSLTNGSSYYSTHIYNDRVQPCWLYTTTGTTLPTTTLCSGTATPGNILDLKYSYNLGISDNGNVMGITNNRATTRSQSFGYDAFNRLDLAETTSTYATSPTNCWGELFQYDNLSAGGAWGNLTNIVPATSAYTGCTQQSMNLTATTKNQLEDTNSDYVYDAPGNLTNISSLDAYSYDAENHLVSTAGVNYLYDGDGHRIAKSTGGSINKIYWYGSDGEVLDETDGTGSISNPAFTEYIFFGGQRVAHRDSTNDVFYYFADHLGSSRTMVQSGQTTLCYDADFYPFGAERTPIINNCQQNYKFTGKEHDTESGLDNFGARYNASSMSRFMSPDAGLFHFLDPQSLNRYVYTLDNPLRFVDPNGMDSIDPELLSAIKDVQMTAIQAVARLIQDYKAGTPMMISQDVGDNLAIASKSSKGCRNCQLLVMDASIKLYNEYLRLTERQVSLGLDRFLNDPKTTSQDIQNALNQVDDAMIAYEKQNKEDEDKMSIPGLWGPAGIVMFAFSKVPDPQERVFEETRARLRAALEIRIKQEEAKKEQEARCRQDPRACGY